MTLANVADTKKILTEKGPVEDSKVLLYCTMADNHINLDLVGTSEPVIPIPSTHPNFKVISNIATALACAYFYKFESGDTITAEQAEKDWDDFFIRKYRSPKFAVSRRN